jgi:4-cresol dehydrogenase (hydroxylating)
MKIALPRNVSNADFSSALFSFSKVVGDDNILPFEQAVLEYGDPYAGAGGGGFLPSAALLPASVDEIRAILAIANQYGIPTWFVSRGRNLGYGGGAPRENGSIVVSLRRMNRILEVNEACAYAVVEPGVSYLDLYEHLRAGGYNLVASVPDLGWGSIIGNALEYGRGYTPHGDHAASHCGMEVVLPNGDLIRTGIGSSENGNSRYVYNHSFGPSLDGLFMQSNLGVVTKMGIWLMPTPEYYTAVSVSVKEEEHLEPLVDIVRELMLNRVIENYPVMANAVTAAASFTRREQWYKGDGPLPEAVIDRICQETGLGRWNLRFALYGKKDVIDAQFAAASAALSSTADIKIDRRDYRGDAISEDILPMDRSQIGIPSLDILEGLRWRGERGGHLGFAPICSAIGSEVREQSDRLAPIMKDHGFDYIVGLLFTPRCILQVCEFVYDADDQKQVLAAQRGCNALMQESAVAGYGEYRAHLMHMDEASARCGADNGGAIRLREAIKNLLDPNGILSPGKQGIWSSKGKVVKPAPQLAETQCDHNSLEGV